MNRAILTRAIWVAMAFLLSISVLTKSLFGQEARKDTSGPAISSSDSSLAVEVIFKIRGEAIDRAGLENIQALLLGMDGVPYVGVNYQRLEIIVRYLPGRTTLEGLTTKIQDTNADDAVLVVRSEVIQAPNSLGVAKDQQSPFGSIFPELSLECLRHDEAQALCEKHFKDELPEGIRLKNCYTIKVDFQTVAHVDNEYDWLSLACLVDEKGKLIKPITWLELPSVSEIPLGDAVSGLLIFPKIPVLRLGLTLRLLRANGEGYDSYTVEIPEY